MVNGEFHSAFPIPHSPPMVYKTLLQIDLRNVRRDAMLMWLPFLPLLLALGLRAAVPWLAALLATYAAFDLRTYDPLILSLFLLLVPGLSGMVVGFLLLDERDERILAAWQVTPLPLAHYVGYRLGLPMLLGMVMTVVGYLILGWHTLSWGALLAAMFLASFSAPMVALFFAAFAPNKVAGMALVKVLNGVMILPLAAYFLPAPWHWIAAVFPLFWPLKMIWAAAVGQPYLWFFLPGLVSNGTAVWLLFRHFRRKLLSA